LRPVRRVARKAWSSGVMVVGIYWRSSVVHHALVILLCSTDVDIVGILVLRIGSGNRSSTVGTTITFEVSAIFWATDIG
jgi:hypothetical protein